MHVDPYIILGSAVVGLLVGLTGAGGGALMTPMLILIFGVKPSTAISSDLVAAVLMRPFGAAVHIRKGTVNFRLVGWLVLGSVPMAFAGAYLLHLLGNGSAAQSHSAQGRVETALGVALLAGAAAMVIRYALDWRTGQQRLGRVAEVTPRPALTITIGAVGGVIVGMTSVGSGSLMIVLLLFLYPMLSAGQLVGTDLTQAVPLTLAAALGALIFGQVQFAVTASIVIGSIPAVLVGSFLSSRAPDRFIRPVITFVILASGLKYAGVGTTALGWILCGVLLTAAVAWLAIVRPWQNGKDTPTPAPAPSATTNPDPNSRAPAAEPSRDGPGPNSLDPSHPASHSGNSSPGPEPSGLGLGPSSLGLGPSSLGLGPSSPGSSPDSLDPTHPVSPTSNTNPENLSNPASVNPSSPTSPSTNGDQPESRQPS